MRYFWGLGAKSTLACGIVEAATTGGSVTRAGTPQRVATRFRRTTVEAIHVTAIAKATQHHLAMTAGAVIQPRAGQLCDGGTICAG